MTGATGREVAVLVGERLKGNACATGAALFWASAFPATQVLLASWHPFPLASVRLGLGSLTMLALAALWRRLPPWGAVPWRQVALIGGGGSAASVACLISGQYLSDPVTAAVIATSQPLVAAIMGFVAARERLHPPLLLGVVLAIAGALLVSPALTAGGGGFRGGEPLLVLNVILWTWYSRAARERLVGLSDLAKGGLTMAAGAVVLALASLLVAGIEPLAVDPSLAALPWLLWMGAVAIGVSVPLWLAGSRILGVTMASLHQNLAPFYVMLIGLGLGGTIAPRQLLGAAAVALGAVVAQLGRRG